MNTQQAHVAVIDHRDSFTFTLVDYCQQLGAKVSVFSVDDLPDCDALKRLHITHVLFSPGPGHPNEYEASLQLMSAVKHSWPLLGVCLGHQMLGYIDGASVRKTPHIMHGRRSTMTHQQTGLLRDLQAPLSVMRYHSLALDPKTLTDDWHLDAYSDDGVLMAMHHKDLPLFGVQFHPESVLTDKGLCVLRAFLAVS